MTSATPNPSPRHSSAPDDVLDGLVERARAGELQAFNLLVARFQDGVFSLTYRMLGSSQAAEDATQEAFVKAWQRIDTFRGGSFRSWVFTIAANQARDELRRRARRPTRSLDEARDDPDRPDLDPPGDEPSPEDEAERGEMRVALEQALLTLPDDWREVVVLSDIHGLDYREIAEATGLALGTVKSRLSRARGRLREVILQSRELSEAVDRLGVRR
jgi:RNA polymerase sigma-70 factor (ECF subfamily)